MTDGFVLSTGYINFTRLHVQGGRVSKLLPR